MDRNQLVNAIRILSIDQVEKANSGHPGAPMGAAPMTFELFANHMNFNPEDPAWANRDRFVLSAGHASALQYSLLHLFGYKVSVEDLKNFRQMDSITPGHPEYHATPGVECTTGPLGAGLSMSVGMALASKHLGSIFNKDDFKVFDNYIYVYAGDGCMMEGITSEASSFAGNLGLDNLIVFYDSNDITIEGGTDLAFTEDVKKRYEAYGWNVENVSDGNNLEEISNAIESAKTKKGKPSLIIVKTKIAYGCPELEGKSQAHGSPLGEENVKATRKNLGWKEEEPFKVSRDIYEEFDKYVVKKKEYYNSYQENLKRYFEKYPEMKEKWDIYFNKSAKEMLDNHIDEFFRKMDKKEATRASSGNVLQKIKEIMPNFIGGSADLAPSNKSDLKNEKSISKSDFSGRNIHYGIRENAMVAIANGILTFGGIRTYIATFFVFSDYAKPMLRLSSIMGVPLIAIFTHDSIGVGEDGATHQPIEQAAMFRAMPNFNVFRPADAFETECGYYLALTNENTPTAMILSRQNLEQLEETSKDALKGGYILKDSNKEIPDGIIISSGSELQLALKAREELLKDDIDVRVVSMPCQEIFEEQSDEYKETILPSNIEKRLAVEALSSVSWYKYVGLKGKIIGIDNFGQSSPADKLFVKYGFTVENVVNTFKEI